MNIERTYLFEVTAVTRAFPLEGIGWIPFKNGTRLESNPVSHEKVLDILDQIRSQDPEHAHAYHAVPSDDNNWQVEVKLPEIDGDYLNCLSLDEVHTSFFAEHTKTSAKKSGKEHFYDNQTTNLAQTLDENTITVYSRNLSDGIGDAKSAIDVYLQLKEVYKNTNTKIKLILLIDDDRLKALDFLIPKEFQNEIDISELGDSIPDTKANKSIHILSMNKQRYSGFEVSNDITTTVDNTPFLAEHLKKSNLFFNISSPLHGVVTRYINPKCQIHSIGEYGPVNYANPSSFSSPVLPVVHSHLGIGANQAGMKFDSTILDYADLTETYGRESILARCKNTSLINKLAKIQDNSTFKQKLEAIKYYLDYSILAVGYVQSEEAAKDLLLTSMSCIYRGTGTVDIIMPAKFINPKMIKYIGEQGYNVEVLGQDGSVIYSSRPAGDTSPLVRVIDYNGFEEDDLKILTAVANVTAGSGDNSFVMVCSNPNTLPLIELNNWKEDFFKSFYNDFVKIDDQLNSRFKHLRAYLSLNSLAPSHARSTDTSGYLTGDRYVSRFADQIVAEWKEFIEFIRNSKNYNKNLSAIIYASAVQQSLTEQKNSIDSSYIQHIMNTNDETLIANVLYGAILNNDSRTVEEISNRLESLPNISGDYSLTHIALALNRLDIAKQLLQKDLYFYQKMDTLWKLPAQQLDQVMKFMEDNKIDVSMSKAYSGGSRYGFEQDENYYYQSKGLNWLHQRNQDKTPIPYTLNSNNYNGHLYQITPDFFIFQPDSYANQRGCDYRLISFKGKQFILEKINGEYHPSRPIDLKNKQLLENAIDIYKEKARLNNQTMQM